MSLEMNEELLLKKPEEIAGTIYKNKSPSDTQLRKFFDDFMVLKKHADAICSSSDEEKDNKFKKEILPLIKFSKIKIAYAVSRCDKREFSSYNDFYKKMEEYINKIETMSDFVVFLKFYEAIIAFVKYKRALPPMDKDKSKENKEKNGGKLCR